MYSVPRVRFSLICIDYLAYSIIVSVLPLSTHWFLPTRLVESSNDYRVTRKTQDSTLHHTTPHSLVFFFFFFFLLDNRGGACTRPRAMRLWNHIEETFPNPPYFSCAFPLLMRRKCALKFNQRGVLKCALYDINTW